MPAMRRGEDVSKWDESDLDDWAYDILVHPDNQVLHELSLKEKRDRAPGYKKRLRLLKDASQRRGLGSDWGEDEFRTYQSVVLTHGKDSSQSDAAYDEFVVALGQTRPAILAAPPKGELEKERVGALDVVLAPFLAGERASGSILYSIRKRLGFRDIDWIEQREAGEIFKEISPSQALGISTPETKLFSKRGMVAFGLDVALDPTSYIGVGLIGKGGKGLKSLKIGEGTERAITVGEQGIEYIRRAVEGGRARSTAERNLLEAIGRGQTQYVAARKYAEPSVHIFNQVLFYTRPKQALARRALEILPYAERREEAMDVLRTAFVPFYKVVRDAGVAAKKPFQTFYRRGAARTAQLGKRIEDLYGATPKTEREEIVLALEKGIEPTSPQAKEAALQFRRIYDEAFEEQLALGMVKPEQYRELYMHHALSKEGKKWMKRELGSEYEAGMDIAAYRKKLGSAEERRLEGDVYEVNKRMRDKYGIDEFFIEDPYLATQMFEVQHVRATESYILHRQTMAEFGRDVDELAPSGTPPKVVRVDGIEHTLFKHRGEETYLPTAMVDELKRTKPATGFWKDVYDPALGSLKKAWISVWPGFYSRNVYGGVGWQNVLAGVEPEDYARNINILYGDPAKTYDIPLYGRMSGTEIKELMESYNVYGQTGFVGEQSSYITGLGAFGRAYKKVPEQAMHLTENQLRGSVFLHYLYKTGDPEFASEMVYKYHFEYLPGARTEFESSVMSRTVPFYSWLRGNIPLQTEMAIRQPGKYASLAKAREMATTPEEYNLQTDWQKGKITYVHNGRVISVDLPATDLPGLYGRDEAYFGLTPFLKWGMRMLEGRDEYGRKMDPLSTQEGLEQHAEMTAMAFAGRYVYAYREMQATVRGDRPLAYTLAHQLAGVGIYELTESFEQIEDAYESAKYTKPTPTDREKALAWAAQGKVAGANVFALPLPEEEMDKMWHAVGTMLVESNDQTVKRTVEKLEDTGIHNLYRLRGYGTLVSLTAEEREITKMFSPTDEQLKLLQEISELGVTESGATARDLYLEMYREYYATYSSRLYQREAFTDAERMAAVSRRPAGLTGLRFKEIRYANGEKAGILALTEEEYEDFGRFDFSEAQKKWMFREGIVLPKEGYERYREDTDAMYSEIIAAGGEIPKLPAVKMAPAAQAKIWAAEAEERRLQEAEWRKEYAELRADPYGTSISRKGVSATVMMARAGDTIAWRQGRMKELETCMGTGVDR